MNFAAINYNQAGFNYAPHRQIWPTQDYSLNSSLFCLISHALKTSVSEFEKTKLQEPKDLEPIRNDSSVVVIRSDSEEEEVEKSLNFQIRQTQTIEDKNSITQTRENLFYSQPDEPQQCKNTIEITLSSLNQEFQKQKNIETPIIYEIECPKIWITKREIQAKKQQLMARKVLDWSKVAKKTNDNLEEYRARQMRMLFK